MRATETEGVEFASYRLKGVAYSWFEMWEDSCEEGSPPARWSEFVDAFIDQFLPAETKAAHAVEFETLKQGSKNVWEYHMEFVCLSKYVVHMMPTMAARRAVKIARQIKMVCDQERGPVSDKRPRYFGYFSGASSRGRGTFVRVHPPRPFQLALQASPGASGSRGPYVSHPRKLSYSAPSALISAPPIQR
ncbi:uncharacterized protein [Nicotiana tomentosiformis]|uniref:uncharacterized protein n=1 Tax=Nicotiana tomentosiformis TaxID=4098 RepID=UPI00388C87DE